MTMMFDLPEDVVEEIFSRVPITYLGVIRSTCKQWNDLSKDRILCRAETKQQFLGFMMKDFKVCSMRFDLNGIHNEDVEISIKELTDEFNQVKIFRVIHCDGILLLVTFELFSRLVVWNPYLGQTTWIKTRHKCRLSDRYGLGYDNNHKHKILRCMENENSEIYDCKSKSWRVLDHVNPGSVFKYQRNIQSVSLKGNAYFFAGGGNETFLVCFDFTRERFGSYLSLPFHVGKFCQVLALYSIREEQLAVLYSHWDRCNKIEIWVTTKIEPNAVSWSNFLTVAVTYFKLPLFVDSGSFFIDQEKKLAVLFCISVFKDQKRHIAYIIGETGFLRIVDLGLIDSVYHPLPVCSFTPRLVQINQGQELRKKIWRLLTSLFYSTLFVSFIILFIYFIFF